MKKDYNAKYKRRLMKKSIKQWKEVATDIIKAMNINHKPKVFDAGAGYGEFLLALGELNIISEGLYIDNNYQGYNEEVFEAYKLDQKYFNKFSIKICDKSVLDKIHYEQADLVSKMWLPHISWKEMLKSHRPNFIITTDRENEDLSGLGYTLIDTFFHCSEESMMKDKEYIKYHGMRKPFLLYQFNKS